jgi:hypothetical protein
MQGAMTSVSTTSSSRVPLRWIGQNGVTIFAEIQPGAEAQLIAVLDDIGGRVTASGLPFARSANIHYARFVLIDADIDPLGEPVPASLMYLADFDGSVESHLAELVNIAASELARISPYLKDQIPPVAVGQINWLRSHIIPNATYYVNTIGRTVQQIRGEADLRQRIEVFLEGVNTASCTPAALRRMIQDFVQSTPALQWVCDPPASDLRWRLRKFSVLVAGGLIAVPSAILLSPLLLVWLLTLRCREDFDPDDPTRPDPAHIATLASTEDHTLQNQFSALGFVKPGWFRRANATVILWAGKIITRYLFSYEDLAGVKTIHFARWTFIDGKRRLLFSSNYDGSLENYMGDFIDIVWWGLNAIFSNGVGYPHTRWALFLGAKDEGAFKRHIRNRQITTQVWYAAYPNLSATNIATNARIRADLFGVLTAAATRAWLSLL